MRFLVSLVLVGGASHWLWSNRRRRRALSGLDSKASYSSCVIAAWRANESAKQDPLVVDPLAAALAGPLAMADIQKRGRDSGRTTGGTNGADSGTSGGSGTPVERDGAAAAATPAAEIPRSPLGPSPSAPAAPPTGSSALAPSGPTQRPVQRIIMRTIFFDHTICEAVGRHVSDADCLQPLRSFLATAGTWCTQVVLLGAGMDTRPWRLDLPPGVAWYEVDRGDVVKAKRRSLVAAGAALEAPPPQGGTSTQGSANTQGGTGSSAPAPSTAATPPPPSPTPPPPSSSTPSHPLRSSSWTTVVADLQRPGWSRHLVKAGLDPRRPAVYVLEGLLYYMEADSVPGMLREAASISAPGSVLAASIVSRDLVDDIKRRGLSRDSIMTSWKWGCPGEPSQYFGDNGWQVLSFTSWPDAAASYSLTPIGVREGSATRTGSSTTGYVVSVVQTQ